MLAVAVLEIFGLVGNTQFQEELAVLEEAVQAVILLELTALLVEQELLELTDVAVVAEVQAITQQIQPMVALEL